MLLQSEFHATIKSATTQIDGKTAECSSLTQQLDSRTQEWQQLQSELKAVADLREQAVESAATHQRYHCCQLQELRLFAERCGEKKRLLTIVALVSPLHALLAGRLVVLTKILSLSRGGLHCWKRTRSKLRQHRLSWK